MGLRITPSQLIKLVRPELNSLEAVKKTVTAVKLINKKRLLIVEDNAINRLVASNLFTDIGFEVFIAEDGKIAVLQIRYAGTSNQANQ